MGYGWKNENGKITVARIHYDCKDCNFTTTDQDEEKIHYATGHYLSSRMGELELYDISKHGEIPAWLNND